MKFKSPKHHLWIIATFPSHFQAGISVCVCDYPSCKSGCCGVICDRDLKPTEFIIPPSSIYPPISAPDSPAHNLCDISQKKGVVQNIHFFNFLGRFGSFGLKHTYWLQRCCKACKHLPGNTRASPSRHERCEGLRVGPPGLESTPGCSLRMLGSLPNSISIHSVCTTVPISAPLYCMFLGIRGFVVLFSASFLWKILNLQKRRKDFSECPCKYQFTLTLLPFWCLLSVFQLKIFTLSCIVFFPPWILQVRLPKCTLLIPATTLFSPTNTAATF